VTHVRLATPLDFERIRAVERAAGELFRGIGMPEVADDEPPTDRQLDTVVALGTAWVAVDADEVVGYLLLELLDGRGHIEQVTVHPGNARHGIGAALIRHAARWAFERGIAELSLTTFAHVPWNAPYYSRLGFEVVPAESLTGDLHERMRRETAEGLAESRVAMIAPCSAMHSTAVAAMTASEQTEGRG
jgi:GNAT superfamily N-acetyltransferase